MFIPKLPNDGRRYDVCVIGAGPVGITTALECEAAGLTVLLLEAGQPNPQRNNNSLSEVEIASPLSHASLDVTTRSGLGGTSAVWGGRCVPYDDIDFERRSFVPYSGWPITHQDVKPWYSRAAYYLDCGTEDYAAPDRLWEARDTVLFQTIERLSSQPRVARRFRDKLKDSRLVSVCLNHAVSGLELDADGALVRGVRFASGQSAKTSPTADIYVLACGGLRATGMLLEMQRDWPQHFGGDTGSLGKFYMGHLTGSIANIVLHNPADAEHFDYQRDTMGYWTRRRFTFSSATQTRHEILNTALWLASPPLYDPTHGSATASTLYLALKIFFGLRSQALLFHRGDQPVQLRDHLSNILRNPPEAFDGILKAVNQYLTRDDLRPLFIRNERGKYALRYHSEAIPNPSSRIRLIREHRPGIGISVDFRFTEDDARSVVQAHSVLDDALRQSGKGYIEYRQKPEQRLSSVMAQALDGYHQIGTTRMGDNKRTGVVDRNCRVFDLQNLYVASSSVFNTSGQANPTFLAVAMAARLADHLNSKLAVRH